MLGFAFLALTFFFGDTALAQMVFEPGTFQGLLQSDSKNDESFGFMTLTLTSAGKFTVRFNLGVNQIGRHAYSKTGQFDQNGAYHFEGPPVTDTRYAIARVIDLQLDPVGSPIRIHGNVTDLTHSSTVELERVAVFDAASPAPQTGRYSFLVENSGNPGLPAGAGFGTVSVSSNGRIRASGKSGDGWAFTQSAALTRSGRWPVFVKLGGSTKGIYSGWITFQDTSASDFSGMLAWLGPEVPGPNNAFVPGFSGDVQAVGSRYFSTVNNPVLQSSSSTNNVRLTLNAGGFETPSERDVTLTTANKFVFNPRLTGDALTVVPSAGLFTGRFLHPDNRIITFRGAVLQKQNRGAGEFVLPDGEVGRAQLTPAP